jgi:hypothetical protein
MRCGARTAPEVSALPRDLQADEQQKVVMMPRYLLTVADENARVLEGWLGGGLRIVPGAAVPPTKLRRAGHRQTHGW